MPDKPSFDNMPEEIRQISHEVAELKLMLQYLIDRAEQKDKEETWMNVPESAKFTGYAEQTVRTLTMQNRIPSHKIEGKRMFLKSEIINCMKTY